jgi:hypothetical protein
LVVARLGARSGFAVIQKMGLLDLLFLLSMASCLVADVCDSIASIAAMGAPVGVVFLGLDFCVSGPLPFGATVWGSCFGR